MSATLHTAKHFLKEDVDREIQDLTDAEREAMLDDVHGRRKNNNDEEDDNNKNSNGVDSDEEDDADEDNDNDDDNGNDGDDDDVDDIGDMMSGCMSDIFQAILFNLPREQSAALKSMGRSSIFG